MQLVDVLEVDYTDGRLHIKNRYLAAVEAERRGSHAEVRQLLHEKDLQNHARTARSKNAGRAS